MAGETSLRAFAEEVAARLGRQDVKRLRRVAVHAAPGWASRLRSRSHLDSSSEKLLATGVSFVDVSAVVVVVPTFDHVFVFNESTIVREAVFVSLRG